MLEFSIFAMAVLLSLIAIRIYLFPGSRNPTTIPGLNPVTREDGNFPEIAKAGSLHEFLVGLHKQFGPIASFWYGPIYTISISNAKLFKEHQHAFDRPVDLFLLIEDFIGSKSIQYANGTDARARRSLYDKPLTHDACKRYFPVFQGVANDIAKKWMTLLNGEHIPLSQYMSAYALKCVLLALFGNEISNDKDVTRFKKFYDILWTEMELRLTSPVTQEREKKFTEARDNLLSFVMDIVRVRRENRLDEDRFIDLLIDHVDDEEQIKSDSVSYVTAGFHTTGNTLTWCLYFLATHQDCQDKLFDEITEVLKGDEVDHTNIGELVYTRQVLDETLRCAVVGPWAARYLDFESELGGHKVPKNTPVIHALGVSLVNEQVWPMPEKFDPERFSPQSCKRRPYLAYVPFGFAGKRVCPGQRFAYIEATIALVTLLRQFKVRLVEGQVIKKIYGLVTHPSDEIWITLQKR